MKYRVYTRMYFFKDIEAASKDEAWQMAEDLDINWEDCYDQEVSEIVEVRE